MPPVDHERTGPGLDDRGHWPTVDRISLEEPASTIDMEFAEGRHTHSGPEDSRPVRLHAAAG